MQNQLIAIQRVVAQTCPIIFHVGASGCVFLKKIEAPDDDTLGSNKVRHCDIHVPMEPCPKFVSMADGVLGELNVQFNNWCVPGNGQ